MRVAQGRAWNSTTGTVAVGPAQHRATQAQTKVSTVQFAPNFIRSHGATTTGDMSSTSMAMSQIDRHDDGAEKDVIHPGHNVHAILPNQTYSVGSV
jgi:archaellum biogenesis protein FlaJ (TadC family)